MKFGFNNHFHCSFKVWLCRKYTDKCSIVIYPSWPSSNKKCYWDKHFFKIQKPLTILFQENDPLSVIYTRSWFNDKLKSSCITSRKQIASSIFQSLEMFLFTQFILYKSWCIWTWFIFTQDKMLSAQPREIWNPPKYSSFHSGLTPNDFLWKFKNSLRVYN